MINSMKFIFSRFRKIMKIKVVKVLNYCLSYWGVEVVDKQWEGVVEYVDFSGASLYVGSGEHILPGYINCDLRRVNGVKLVCAAWNISNFTGSTLKKIYSRHMLEHLTFYEMKATLKDWYKSLSLGGSLEIWVPNMDFHLTQFKNANWTLEDLKRRNSDARWSLAGFWGWAKDTTPGKISGLPNYWDVHKMGYNKDNIKLFLELTGFSEISVNIVDECHLVAKAKKI